ncbi:MAG: O-antigen ligase family protein [Actinobacteria bacterium]|nr:O-antigen ligase family protein [Actinomycetota bacterium]
MSRLWGLAAVLLAAVGGAASTRFPLLTVAALAGIVAVVAVSRNRAMATAALLPLCLLPYAVGLGGLLLGPSDALLIVVAGALLLDWALGHEPGPLLGPLAVPAVAFVVWTAMSAAWAADPVAVMVEAAQRAAFVLGGMAVVHALPADGRAVRRAVVALVAGCVVLGAATAVTGALQGRWLHVYALGMHKNWLGFMLSFGLVALVALAFEGERRSPIVWLAAGLPITVGLLMSGSRGGWIGALAGTAVIVVLQRPLLGWPALSAAAAAIALLFLAAPGLTTERIDVSTADTSAGTRLRTWSSGVEAIRERPILGHGAGNFVAVIKDRGSQVDPNNLTLLAWAETGIFGLLFLAALFAGAFRLALSNSSLVTGTESLANTAGAGIVMAALAHAQFDMFWTRGVALSTFMAVGLVLWSHRQLAVGGSIQPHAPAVVSAA